MASDQRFRATREEGSRSIGMTVARVGEVVGVVGWERTVFSNAQVDVQQGSNLLIQVARHCHE